MIKTFNDFLFENESQDFEKNFLEKVEKHLEESEFFDDVNLDLATKTLSFDRYNTIDDDKEYSVGNISRPTINQEYNGKIVFKFNESNIKKWKSQTAGISAKFGLSDPLKFTDLFTAEVATQLVITVDELEDFHHTEGDIEDFNEQDLEYDTEEEFLDDIADQLDDWFNEYTPPVPGHNLIRDLLDKYEEENGYDDEDDEDGW